MRRTWLFCAVIALCPAAALTAWLADRARADKPAPAADAAAPTTKLPLTQVVLFNTGLGYFQREGEVDGESRVDLSIPTTGLNDILKTLLIDNAGKPTAVSYEGAEPLESKLRSFAIDLAGNPTLGQLLNLARGEKVELTVEGTGAAAPMTGTIVGMEAQFEDQSREVHHLNLMGRDGVCRVPLQRVQRVRFLDPALDDEFRRALSVLSAGRADQRRRVSVRLGGEGKRKVKVGHVAETPIWKATYRLVLGDKDVKPSLQGWAIVENTTEEDWKGVRVALVSGRPITFEMDLAQQLFMPRPKLEPEVFASLRPPTFAPAAGDGKAPAPVQSGGMQLGGIQLGSQIGMGGMGQRSPLDDTRPEGAVVAAAGPSLFGPGGQLNRYQPVPGAAGPSRLSYEELQKRRSEMLEKRKESAQTAREVGGELAALGDGIDDVVTTADRIGEGFRYRVEPRVDLPRQKAGLLSVLSGPITLERLSVYNPSVHPRFPLRSVRLKNSTGQHLMQGPLAVYEGGDYAGDARLPDLQPGQERLLSYAMDLGLEVRPSVNSTDETTGIEASLGALVVKTRATRRTHYRTNNRSGEDRGVLIEHDASAWTLAEGGEKPAESTRQTHRFRWKVAAGAIEWKAVDETQTLSTARRILEADTYYLEHIAASPKASAALAKALRDLVAARQRGEALRAEIKATQELLKPLLQEQARLLGALPNLPNGSDAHKRSLKRYDEQEAHVEKLQQLLAEKVAAELKQRTEYEKAANTLTVK